MKQITLLSFCIVTLSTLVSCKKDSASRPANCTATTNWIKNGHRFVYKNEPIYIYGDTMYVSVEEVSTGVFKSTTIFDDGTMYPASTSYVQDCNNSIYQGANAAMDNKQEVYRMDGNIGDSWVASNVSTGGYNVTTTVTIAAKNVPTTVPAGTFNCIKLHSVSVSSNPASGTAETDFYLNNDEGLVLVDGTTAHYELVRKNY